MARHVKCYITGEQGTSDTFVKHDNHYYKSEKIYQDHIKEMDYRNKIIDIIVYDYLGFSKDIPFPTIINKRLNEIKHFGYETIYRTIQSEDTVIRRAIAEKQFDSAYLEMMYILAIIKNNIFKTWKIVLAEKREERKQEEPITNTKLQDIQNVKNPKQKVKDISKYLEEE